MLSTFATVGLAGMFAHNAGAGSTITLATPATTPTTAVAAVDPATNPATDAATNTAGTTATTATETATTPIFALLGFIHPQRTTVKLEIVERRNSFIGGCIFHLDETKASKTSGVTIGDPPNRRDSAVLLEQFADFVFGNAPRQITNVQ